MYRALLSFNQHELEHCVHMLRSFTKRRAQSCELPSGSLKGQGKEQGGGGCLPMHRAVAQCIGSRAVQGCCILY